LKAIVVIGAGGLGREALDILKRSLHHTYKILGFIDDNIELHGTIINDYPVLGGCEWFKENPNTLAVCAIGDNYIRKSVTDRAKENGANFTSVIDPSATIGYGLKIGEGVIIVQGNTITSNVTIGNHVYVNIDCSVAHDDVLEDYVNICPGVQLSGNVTLKEGVMVYTGAIIAPGVTVGKWAEVGAGAVVLKDVPDYMLVAGIPANIKKDVRSRHNWKT